MYGRAFESMYEGSMVGAGLHVFAVWNYVIAKGRHGSIELNPRLLKAVLGGTIEEIIAAIDTLCAPDPESRSKEEEGRRLVREGQFQYRIVNWGKYNAIRTEAERREYNRVKQQEYRAKKKPKPEIKPLTKEPVSTDEHACERNFENGLIDEDGLPTKSERPVPSRAELIGEGI